MDSGDALTGTPAMEAYRLLLLGRIADDLSHEIKNPLHAMVINLELVKRRVQSGAGEAALDRVAVVEEEIHRVHKLIDAFLRVIRPGSAGVKPTELDRILEELLPVLKAQAKVCRSAFALDGDAEGLRVQVDARFLKHALLDVLLALLDEQPAASRVTAQVTAEDDAVLLDLAAESVAEDDEPVAAPAPALPERIDLLRALAATAGASLEWSPGTGGRAAARCRLLLPRSRAT